MLYKMLHNQILLFLIFTVLSTKYNFCLFNLVALFLLNLADQLQLCPIYGSLYCNCSYGGSEQYFFAGEMIWFPGWIVDT